MISVLIWYHDFNPFTTAVTQLDRVISTHNSHSNCSDDVFSQPNKAKHSTLLVDRSHHFSIEIANYSCNFYFKCFLFHTYLLLDSLPVNYNLKNKCFVNYNTLLDSCSIYCPFSSVTFFHFPSLYCLCSLGTNCVIVALTPSTAIMMDFI